MRNAHRLATGGTFLLVTFLCVQRKVTPMNNEAPSARATCKMPQPFWLTATLPRINAPAINICTVTASPRNNQANAAPNNGTR